MKEFELINKIKSGLLLNKKFVKKGIGDDCAVLNYSKDFDLLVTTDMLTEDVHFNLEWYSPSLFAKKILYCNFSDIYACGGEPITVIVSAGISNKMDEKYLYSFIKYLKSESKKFNCNLIGGDTVSSKKITFSITMFGLVKKAKSILRSTAKAGDKVYITGYPGLSEAGLNLLIKNISLDKKYKKFLVRKHLIPSIITNKILLKKIFKISNSMIDVSDGLSSELNHISKESNKKIIVEKDSIPIHVSLKKFCKEYNKDIYNIILSGGEDFYLLFTSDKNINKKNIFKIGTVEKGKGVYLKDREKITKIKSAGWEHSL